MQGEMEAGSTAALVRFLREKLRLDEHVCARFRVQHVDAQVVLAC
jgi:hypothetical protein